MAIRYIADSRVRKIVKRAERKKPSPIFVMKAGIKKAMIDDFEASLHPNFS